MTKCDKCIHADVCTARDWFDFGKLPVECKKFKDKDSFVEVVRCEDCKHYNDVFMYCEALELAKVNDGFCNFGERKVDDEI